MLTSHLRLMRVSQALENVDDTYLFNKGTSINRAKPPREGGGQCQVLKRRHRGERESKLVPRDTSWCIRKEKYPFRNSIMCRER